MKLDTVKFTNDLTVALRAAWVAAAASDDGGTCNLDTLVVILPGCQLTTVEAAARAGGALYVSRWRPGEFSIGIGAGGQANSRMRAVEAARDSLKAAGWNAWVWYQVD